MTLRLDRAIAVLALAALCGPALAQQPTQQQNSAIRSNCRSDFVANCSGVPRGGAEAVRCLKDHMDKLSRGCRRVVSGITLAPAPAPAPAVAPGPAPAAPPAPAPATAAPTEPPAPPAAAAPPPATGPAVPPAAGTGNTTPSPANSPQAGSLLPLPTLAPRVRLMIVRTCAAEQLTLCSSLPAGGGVVECLAEHGDALSSRCHDAIVSAKRAGTRPRR